MVRRLTASQLYNEGHFNYVTIRELADGTITVTAGSRRGPGRHTFRARRFLEKDEQLLDDPELEVADEPAAHPAPVEG